METTILLGGASLFYKILQQIFSYTGVTLLSIGTIDSGSRSNSSLHKLMEISKQPCHIVVSILKNKLYEEPIRNYPRLETGCPGTVAIWTSF